MLEWKLLARSRLHLPKLWRAWPRFLALVRALRRPNGTHRSSLGVTVSHGFESLVCDSFLLYSLFCLCEPLNFQ
jgi:hypothetical protein